MKSFAKKLIRNKTVEKAYHNIPFKKEIFSGLNKLNLVPEKIQWYLRFKGEFEVAVANTEGFKMLNPGYFIENNIFWNGIDDCWERESLKIWQKLARHSNTIFDIGANTGIYSLIAKTVKPTSSVYAIEPLNRICSLLKKNNRINEFDINCLNYAVSDSDGTAKFYDVETTLGDVSSASLSKDFQENQIELEVKVRTLSTLIQEFGIEKIDLMKVDVETFEPQVLKGFHPYLEAFKPALLIEILDDSIGAAIENQLNGLDYIYFDIDDTKGLTQKSKISKSTNYNYLLCSEEMANKIELL